MKSNLQYLCFILVLLSACKKQESFTPSGIYVSEDVASLSPVRMFTMNGEVKDTAVIYSFIKNKSSVFSPLDLHPYQTQRYVTPKLLRLEFNSTGLTVIKNMKDYSPYLGADTLVTKKADYILQGSDLIITEVDSMWRYIPEQWSSSHNFNLAEKSLKFRPVEICSHVFGGPYDKVCVYRPMYLVKASGIDLSLQMIMVYAFSYGSNFGRGDWDVFDPGVMSYMAIADTVLFQEKQVLLKKN